MYKKLFLFGAKHRALQKSKSSVEGNDIGNCLKYNTYMYIYSFYTRAIKRQWGPTPTLKKTRENISEKDTGKHVDIKHRHKHR